MVLLSFLAALIFLVVTIVFSIVSAFVALIDRSGTLYLLTGRLWSRIGLGLFGIRVTVTGTENINGGTGFSLSPVADRRHHYVYVANHTSYMDIPILLGYIPDNLRLTLRSTLTRIPIWGWALLVSPFIVLDRGDPAKAQQTIRKAIDVMRHASVLFFPEGTRTHTGEMQAFKRGAFHLARQASAPILPVAVIGAYDILPRDKWLPRWGRRAEIRIGKPIAVAEVPPDHHRAEEIRIMREAEQRVRDLLG